MADNFGGPVGAPETWAGILLARYEALAQAKACFVVPTVAGKGRGGK